MNLATTLLNSVATQGSVFQSLRLRRSVLGNLSRTPGSSGNTKTMTFSTWFKYSISTDYSVLFSGLDNTTTDQDALYIDHNTHGGKLVVRLESVNNEALVTSQVFRDPSAWYHIVMTIDTTQATASNRLRLYLNGSEITNFVVDNRSSMTQNSDMLGWNTNRPQYIGSQAQSAPAFTWNGYVAQTYFVDGLALGPSAFGRTNQQTGVWEPTYFQGTYGTNGFHLTYSNPASTTTIGYDYSGNGNNFTANNVSVTAGATYDPMPDVPTLSNNVSANYCTLNTVMKSTADVVVSNGALTVTSNYASGWQNAGSTFAVKTGKWYYEASASIVSAVDKTSIGVLPETVSFIGNINQDLSSYGISGHGAGTGGYSYAQGDTIMVAIDADNSKVYYGKNGTWFGTLNPSAGTGSTTQAMTPGVYYTPIFGGYGGSQWNVNFGQQTFAYTVPTGFKTLNAYNLPDSAVVQGNRYMDATLYTGTGSNGLTVTNSGGFYPDLIWIKSRNAAYYNTLLDYPRGASVRLFSNLSDAESNNGCQSSFNSNGFTLNADAGGVNNSGTTYVAWQWNAGSGTTSTNTDGTVTSTVDVNTTAGFSILKYTGTSSAGTVGHGLGVAPAFIIAKSRNNAGVNWITYHQSTGKDAYMNLNTTNASASLSNYWGTSVNSTTFGFLSNAYDNANGNVVAYCWAEIAGFSKFGSYTGNGSTDGPFVYCGFRPKFFMVKQTDGTSDWIIYDSTRNPSNLTNLKLFPNTSTQENVSDPAGVDISTNNIDMLSNGIKQRNNNTWTNNNGSTYIYAAFAENPFKNALAR